MTTDGITCHNEFMQAMIDEKYGAGLPDKVYARADSLYRAEQKKKQNIPHTTTRGTKTAGLFFPKP